MTTAEKSEAILKKILETVNADTSEQTEVSFGHDWGGNSATISITGKGHTHVGGISEDATWEQFIDELYRQFHGGSGLSWA